MHNDFITKTNDTGKKNGADVYVGPPKTADRITQKANNDYGGDVTQVRDANRATFAVGDPVRQLPEILESIRRNFGEPTRIKDNYSDAPDTAFKKIIVNYKTAAGHEAEIQITTPEMWDARKTFGGHALYKKIRDGEGSPLDRQVMDALYQAADDAAKRRLSSAA